MNTSYGVIIAYVLFLALATLCHPEFFADNTFLNGFAGADLLSLLAVILAITFASVANIHLAINQIVGRAFSKDVESGQKVARPLRADINSNAWLLFYAFLVAIGALLIKAMFLDNTHMRSAMNGIAAGTLIVNTLVFRDIYCVVFELAGTDLAVKGAQPPNFDPEAPQVSNDA